MHSINTYLHSIWLTEKESHIFVILFSLWTVPASTVARVAKTERVWTYKCLQKFADMGIIAHSIKQKVKHFWIPSLDLLKQYIITQKTQREGLEEDFETIHTLFQEHLPQHKTVPKIQIYDSSKALHNVYQDMLMQIQQEHIIHCKLFATNTFDTQLLSHASLWDHSGNFFDILAEKNITIQSYIAEGSLVMESLTHSASLVWIPDLPAWNNAINIFVIAQVVYIIIYKNPPIALKLASAELAWALHFLLEYTEKVKW